MDKLITISIAAYNSEDFIRKTLESLIVPQKMDLLEVFVIDDGGTDNTLEIAKEYQNRYPQTFFPIHKENGGYGSTVNYSIENATGKYFKLLDGDDWFNTNEFAKLLEILDSEDSDAIVTNFWQGFDDEHLEYVRTHSQNEGEVVNVKEGFLAENPFAMWELVYRTTLLRESNLQLPLHVLYTDRMYFTIPFAKVNTVRFTDACVYCYRIGRDGQSMSLESQFKHFEERVSGMLEICKFYRAEKDNKNPRCAYLLQRVATSHVITARVIRFMPKTSENRNLLKKYETEVARISKDIVKYEKHVSKFGVFLTLCRHTAFIPYWFL